ncbi:putative geraniol 8-hydroxylase [Rosa chinensis]|uniref:Putative geraniol 8-hydroxylase n=1 Tax=Rosa chinensis TaxID=74649 RepID=A0A2P6PC22_ROSCH|nr:putative geraniol 8-hydroxylase [Rosa chinensis]
MSYGGHTGSFGCEASISTRCCDFAKVIDIIDVSLLERPDSCNSVFLDCLYRHGVTQSVLTYEAISQLLWRRICPGLPLAIRMLYLMLGSLINCFDWELEDGVVPETMNMEDKFGLTLQMAQPLRVCLRSYRRSRGGLPFVFSLGIWNLFLGSSYSISSFNFLFHACSAFFLFFFFSPYKGRL